jgi:hypothetical protein
MNLESHDHPDQNPDCEGEARESRHASTGPRTPEGKAISSQNATKHGCRSKTIILPHENPAEYQTIHNGWWDKYQPSGHAEETLVKLLIDNHWFLLRATKRMEQVDCEMPADPCDWTDAHHRMINNFTRYKTTAERAFHKSFRAVETYFRDCARAEINALKADLTRAKIEAQLARQSRATEQPRPERPWTPLAEIKAQWERETGGFLGPIKPSSPPQTSQL